MNKKELEIEQLLKEIDNIPGLFRDDNDYDETVTYNSYDIRG